MVLPRNIFNVFFQSVTLISIEKILGQSWPRSNYLKQSFVYGGTKLCNDFRDSLKDGGSSVQSERNMKVSIISDSHTAVM